MLITATIIAGCLYTLGQEQKEKEKKRVAILSEKLQISAIANENKEFSLKDQLKEIIAPFDNTERDEQRKFLNPNDESLRIEERAYEEFVQKNLYLSTAMLGTATLGFVFPVFRIVTLGGLLWGSVPIYKRFFTHIKKRKLTGHIIDTIAFTGMLATGYLAFGALDEMLFYSGEKLLIKTEDRSVKQLVDLFGEQSKYVWLVGKKEDIEIQIPLKQLKVGDIISIHAGVMVPIDGKITYGQALIDQQSLTGESQPVEKGIGDNCLAATIVLEGHIHIQVMRAGEETIAAQIGEILDQTLDYKEITISKGQKTADTSAKYIAGGSLIGTALLGVPAGVALVNTNFSFILELSSPMMVLNFLTIASQEGILIKDGRSLELLHKVDTIVFDKTGTLTINQPHIGKIYTLHKLSEDELLTYAAAAEYRQTHPIALAILQEAENRQLTIPSIDNAKYEIGYGIKVELGDKIVRLGSGRFMKMEDIIVPEATESMVAEGQLKGYSILYLAIDQQLEGIIELHPTLRPETKEIIELLKASNKECYIISGDQEIPTRNLAETLGINHYFAEVLPEDKANLVAQLQQQNKTVCFIGDGINDSIALKTADVSISIRGASTIAIDTAQIVLMTESLNQLPLLFTIGEAFDEHMKNNLAASTIPASFAIGGIFFLHFGLVAALTANVVSLLAGTANAVHPMITYNNAKLSSQS